MTPESRAELQRIGAELDGHRQVRVRIGGIVTPEPAPAVEAMEKNDGKRQAKTRSGAGPRPRAARRQGSAGRSRSTGAAAQIGGSDLRPHYEAEVAELAKAYPTAKVVAGDAQGMWLEVESSVLDGIDRTATFLVAVPFARELFPRTWAFWNIAGTKRWIGPRHCNFTDGSVCAFVPESGTWRPGDRLDSLTDLYTVWALRHLYLEEFNRWPGRQFSPHPFYSLVEFKNEELCSCEIRESPLTYAACCKPEHLKPKWVDLQGDFERIMGCRITDRNPPAHIIEFMLSRSGLRSVREALTVPAVINRSVAQRRN